MTSVNAGAAEGRGAHAQGDAFQQMLQKIQSIEETLLTQERRLEDLERARQEDQQARVEGAGALAPGFEERLQRLEQQMEEMQRRSLPSERQQRDQTSGVEERVAHLESRVGQLETSTGRDLQSALPRVHALPKYRKRASSLGAPQPTTTSAFISTSGAASAPPPLASVSASFSTPCPLSSAAGSAATPPLTPKRRKELGEQLLKTAKEGRKDDMQKLLDMGADINYIDSLRFTALMYAVGNKHANVLLLLIEKGADVNARNTPGDTALNLASSKDKSGRCTSLLLGAGALVDLANCIGQTPLHTAVTAHNEAAAAALLGAGASTTVRDKRGKKPSEYALTDRLDRLFIT